ncbi:MAG: DDE-type integrase/transposase/recombinase [Candidatus Binataceae bacterium]
MAGSPQIAELPSQTTDARSLSLPVATAPLDPLDGVSNALAARAEAKAEIIAAFRSFKNRSCRTLCATLESFAARYNSGKEQIRTATRELYGEISAASIQRDWRKFEKSGIGALIPRHKGGKCLIDSEPMMRDFVIAAIAHNPSVRAPFVHEGIRVRFPNDRTPDLRSVERFIARWKTENASLYQRIKSPDDWKSRHMLALGDASAGITRVNQLHEIDGTRSDAFLFVETKTGKCQLLGQIDVFSRKVIGHLAPSESSQAVADTLAKAFRILGIPDEIRSDRGAGFLSKRTQRAIVRLGPKWTPVAAYSGWKKPYAERNAMGTVLHGFFANLPGFSGHDPIQASAIRKRNSFANRRGQNIAKLYGVELTMAETQELLDKYLEHVYGNRAHRGLGGRTPNDVFAEAERRGQVRRVADDRLLDLLLGEDGIATITKKGLRVSNSYYWGDELEGYIKERVQWVRTGDQGKLIVYSADSAPKFLCVAVDRESVGIDRQILALAAKQRQAAVMRKGIEDLRLLKKRHRPERVFREIIDSAVARAAALLPATEEIAGGKITALPYRVEAARAALAALDAPTEPAPHDEETLRDGAEALADLDHRRELRELQLSDDELDGLWCAVCREPRDLTLREQRFLAHYQHTAQSWAKLYESTSEFAAFKLLRLGMEGNTKCA